MFDYLRPYPDTNTTFPIIPIGVDSNGVRNQLPIVDESGLSLGLYITLTGPMAGEYLLQVYQDASSENPGQTATLTVDFGSPIYLNQLSLSSYTNFPVNIKTITSQGFTTGSAQTLFVGDLLLETPTDIRLPLTLISTIQISFAQENYTIKQHQVLPDDYLRREALNDLQSVIPVNAQQQNILPQVQFVNGYQYEFGIENISGSRQTSILPSVFISGPYSFNIKPDTLTLDLDYVGNISAYILYKTYDVNNNVTSSNLNGINIPIVGANNSIIFPYCTAGTDTLITGSVSSLVVNRIDIWIKFVLRSVDSSIRRFVVQVNEYV